MRHLLSHVQLDRLGVSRTETLYSEVHNPPEELRVVKYVNTEGFIRRLDIFIQLKFKDRLATIHILSSVARHCW